MTLAKPLLHRWQIFFFEPISPATLGVFRILFALVVLESLIGKYLDRDLMLSDSGLISPQVTANFFSGLEATYNLSRLVPTTDPGLQWFFLGLIVITLSLLVGCGTRIVSVLLFLGLTALSNRNFFFDNAGDDVIRIFAFFLMLAPAGRIFSVDRWWRRRWQGEQNAPQISAWPLRLLQLQLAYIYLDTVFLKLHGPAWLDGTALYYALNYLELKRFEMKWLFSFLWQIKLATWATLIIESAMCTLVWVPRLRTYCLTAALLLHVTINFAMHLPTFQYVMIAALSLFLDPSKRSLQPRSDCANTNTWRS